MDSQATSKRRQGRPARNKVGREALLATAKRLLRELPPGKVTIALIAREAGVDPALVRYYFKDRAHLLFAVAQAMMAEVPMEGHPAQSPEAALEVMIRRFARFTQTNRHIHRLMVDELADAEASDVGEQLGAINRGGVERLAALLAADGQAQLRDLDPTLLYIAMVGLFDFFATAQPVVRQLVPPGTDPAALAKRYEEFVVDLLLNGLRMRPAPAPAPAPAP